MKPKVIAIIQGRMSSSRLPGKILADIAGQPMLTRVYTRTSRAQTLDEVIFATTTDSTDDPVAEYCDFSGIPFTRGSQFDVLDRYYQTAKQAKEPQHREHAMPYIYEGAKLSAVSRQRSEGISPRGFRIALLNHTTDFGDYRWTVDTPEDLEFMRQVYSRFDGRDDFSWQEVLDLVHDEPKLMEINAGVQHKTLKDIDKRALK